MSDGWLTPESARPKADAKLAQLSAATSNRRKTTTHLEDVARAMAAINYAAIELASSHFTHSVGVEFATDPGVRETWYICGSKGVGGLFAEYNVIPWTHWLGKVATQVRHVSDRGDYPTMLKYGPPGRERDLPVGPLVDYFFSEGRIQRIEFHPIPLAEERKPVLDVRTAVEEIATAVEPVDLTPAEPRYGLKTIIRTLDLDQDDQIRGPMQGVFVLTGGPGVGKTTVALHRIPYLILEQNRSDSWGAEKDEQDAPFFTVDSTLVVVWKQHLVPYLRECVQQLVDEFPERNVRHIDKWVVDTLRDYVKLGKGAESWRLREHEDHWIEAAKNSATQQHIKVFLESDHGIRRAAEKAMRDGLPRKLSELLTKRLKSINRLPHLPFDFASQPFSVGAFEALRDSFSNRLPEPQWASRELSEMQQSELRGVRERMQTGYRDALSHLSRYVDLLFEFYRSEAMVNLVRQSKGEEAVEQFLSVISRQQTDHFLSRADTYVLIWLVHLVTDRGSSTARSTRPLPTYSHIVIDEAQYYEPSILKLFGELVRLPSGVLTIVGDLEQRISTDGGLLSWADTGFDLREDGISRLVTNYRWTKEVFDFVELFHGAAEINETLHRPLKWRVHGGKRPEIHTVDDHKSELELVAKRISELRDDDKSKTWTTTVVVPDEMIETTRVELVELLESYFIEARWATGEDVKESVDRVIVTDYGSIVGLEFDCVFTIGVQQRLLNPSRADIQSAWVALTRARKFVCVTRSEMDSIFSRQVFDDYRCE